MAVFRNMKIVHKLSVVAGVLVVGFGGIGATYFHLRHVQNALEMRAGVLREFAIATTRVQNETLASQSVLKDFFLQKDPTLLEQFNELLNDINKTTATLENLTQDERQQQLIFQVRDALSAYQRATWGAADAVVAIGVNENSGVLKDIRMLSSSIGEALKTIQETGGKAEEFTALNMLLLSMRQDEKDFLSRPKDVYIEQLAAAKQRFVDTAQASTLPETGKAQLTQLADAYHEKFLALTDNVKRREQTYTKLLQQQELVGALADSLGKVTEQALVENARAGAAQLQQVHTVFAVAMGTVAVLVLASLIGLAVGLARSLRRLQDTVELVSEGNMEARTRMDQGDELGTLAHAFDTMLDERLAALAEAERERATRLAEAEAENDTLNDSIVTLVQAVSQLSQKDLTVRVPVAEDVTGTVADALNFLTEETAEVLTEVTRISENVATTSRSVKVQSDAVIALADTEREQVTETAEQLAAAAVAMNEIASLAQTCNQAAETAITRTQTALETVNNTVEGIHTIRDTIRETEKRIKRLGERSQEISGAVNLINSIAERTHILALNASMHAASAGEAGRGFAVVADEVQRLAENARQSTEQIAHLVSNIQTETTDTVTTMNTVISQVVEGSRLASQAGEQMRQTQQSTAELVASVRQIAAGAQNQAKVSNTLRDRAGEIVESTRKTSEQLMAQGGQTTRLLEYASRLVRAVRVFTLPTHRVEANPVDFNQQNYTIQMRVKDDVLIEEESLHV